MKPSNTSTCIQMMAKVTGAWNYLSKFISANQSMTTMMTLHTVIINDAKCND